MDPEFRARLFVTACRLIDPEDELAGYFNNLPDEYWEHWLVDPDDPPEEGSDVEEEDEDCDCYLCSPVVAVVKTEPVTEKKSVSEVEPCVREGTDECQQCEKSYRSVSPPDRYSDRSPDSFVTILDSDRSLSVDSGSYDTASDSEPLRTAQLSLIHI